MFRRRILSFCLVALLVSGCITSQKEPASPLERDVREANALLDEGRVTEAIIIAATVARTDPRTPGLEELQDRIVAQRIADRAKGTARRDTLSHARAIQEANEKGLVPDNYGQRRVIRGADGLVRTAPTRMQQELRKPVTVNLENANLAAFIRQIAEAEGVNIIADASLGATAITIHAEDTPLTEILDFIERNMGITFSVGENIIWASAAQKAKGPIPLETRVYRLHYGLFGSEMIPPRPAVVRAGAPAAAPHIAQPDPALLDALKRFVPQPEGAELFYNAKTHALIVKNTRDNLALAEDIIEAMDIAPPQVLIEARFMTVRMKDFSELGVDWIFDNDTVLVDRGRHGLAINRSPIDKDGNIIPSVNFDVARNISAGVARGASFSLSGILDGSSFRAVLHLLESSSKTKTLAVPRVTTVNNRPANVRVGHDFRFFETFKLQDTTSQEFHPTRDLVATRNASRIVPDGKPTLEPLGIELSVTPSVGANNENITLLLIPEKSEYVSDNIRYVQSIDRLSKVYEYIIESVDDDTKQAKAIPVPMPLPVFRRDRIETEVMVRSGETVVMGGLIRTTKQKVVEKVPVLGNIPLIGFLFRNEIELEEQENLMIFVTATIISNTGEELVPFSDIFLDDESDDDIRIITD